jgi:predicted Abi (CAAX) family protease
MSNVNWWVFAGTLSLGFTIGWLVWTFITRTATLTLKALTTVASIAAGGSLLVFWNNNGVGALPQEANGYFLGVFISVLVLGLLKYDPPDDAG